jgi:hypothetical protein
MNAVFIDLNAYEKQPVFLITQSSYTRMFNLLSSGEESFVKSYLSTCPHMYKKDCKCKFFLNFLKDGKMVRLVDGQLKEVISLDMYEERLSRR